MYRLWLALACLTLFVSPVHAQVVINEVSPASEPEWVEIFNTSSSAASLREYTIDFGSDSQKKLFCDNAQIPANGYLLIDLGVSRWLNNSGDVVNLRNGDDLIDSIGYGTGYPLAKPGSGTESITRSPDGSPNWIKSSEQTRKGDTVSFDCPSPTPTPTPSPSPTPTPTPTPSPSPSPTPKPSPSPAPSVVLSLSKDEVGSPPPDGTVAGDSTEIDLSGFGVSPSPVGASRDSPVSPVLNQSRAKTVIAIGSGLVLLSIAGFFAYRRYLGFKGSDPRSKDSPEL